MCPARQRSKLSEPPESRTRSEFFDEPAAGMNPQETQELMMFIRDIKSEFDLTIFLIEHHMEVVMGICERILVLDHGILIAEGSPDVIQSDKRVIEAYLGVD